MKPFLRIDPGNGAAARAYFEDIDDGRFDRKTFDIAIGVIQRIYRKAAVFDERALGCRTAHVESNEVFEAKLFGVDTGADTAADGPRLHQPDGLVASALGGQQTTIGAHHEKRPSKTLLF